MITKLEYIWLDGYKPEPGMRSKVKVVNTETEDELKKEMNKEWGFDGSSTKQAEGRFSDCVLKPVAHYKHSIIKKEIPTIYVLCEVMNPDGTPHESNDRAKLSYEDSDFWIGFEQEYFIRYNYYGPILGFIKENKSEMEPQGKYYCGVGGLILGREFVEKHLDYCLSLGINVDGTNAEVAPGQWEFQVFAKGNKKACDDLWMSRYVLGKLSEQYGYEIEYHPKPLGVDADWNGSGLHTNFSDKRMREEGGKEYFDSVFKSFESRVKEHIDVYGSDNEMRLTGKHETQSIDKFSWGISDRGASIRVSPSTAKDWKGYLEDRRPASNANPYKIIEAIQKTLSLI
jgi:glutamine synthetase